MRILKLWLPVVLWAGFIFFLSSIPGLSSGLGIWDLILRKGAHMTEFAVLTLLFYKAHSGTFAARRDRPSAQTSVLVGPDEPVGLLSIQPIIAAVVFSLFYSISDEWHQSFVNDRHGSWTDVLIDLVGILTAAFFLRRKRGLT